MPDDTASMTVGAAPRLRIVGDCHVRLWGLDADERMRRAFAMADIHTAAASDVPVGASGLVLAGVEWVVDPNIAKGIRARPNVAVAAEGSDGGERRIALIHLGPSATPDAIARATEMIGRSLPAESLLAAMGLSVVDAETVASSYNHVLRKREAPYLFSMFETPLDEAERRTFKGSYKGVTDAVTKYLWPRPARHVTRWAAEWRISPNSVTTLSLVFVILAFYLFLEGAFLSGLVAAWAMTFLDTVDGKLARVTLTSSKWGNVYDHGIDLVHPPFWWAAWWWALERTPNAASDPYLWWSLWIIVIGYVAGRIIEGAFIAMLSFEMHTWTRIDSFMRLITARRNPNLVILTVAALLAWPAFGFHAVAIWTVVCLVFHFVRLGHAMVARLLGQGVTSWLADPAPRAVSR